MIQTSFTKVIKNISYLSVGQVLKFLIRLAAFSFITRSLSVDQYGQFITVIAFCELFQIFTLPGLSKPLVRAACRDPNNVDEILSSKSGIRNISAIFAIVIVNIVVTFLHYDESVEALIRWYSIILLIDSLRDYVRIVFKAFEVFQWVLFSEVFQSICYLILVLITIYLELGIEGLVAASLISTTLSFMVDLINSRKYSRFKLFDGFQVDKVFLMSASIFTLTNTIWLIVSKIDIFMLSILGSNEDIATYGVASRIIFIGLMAISVVSNVIYPPLIKKIKKTGNVLITKSQRKIILLLCGLILVGFFVTYNLSDSIVTAISGGKYLKSAEIFKILLIFVIIQALSTPIKLMLYAVDKESVLLLITLPLPVLKIAFNIIGFELFGIYGVAYATVIVYFIYLISMYFFNMKTLKNLFEKK